jgi:hypothetical protein
LWNDKLLFVAHLSLCGHRIKITHIDRMIALSQSCVSTWSIIKEEKNPFFFFFSFFRGG